MSEYMCADCGNEFDFPDKLYEPDGLDTPPYRYLYVCPRCKSDDIRRVFDRCSGCSEYIYEYDEFYRLKSTGEVFCGECITKGVAK